MVIVGLYDGPSAGAALVIGDKLVAVESQDQWTGSALARGLPWASLEAVLDAAELRNRHVDVVALAGRFSPPFVARRFAEMLPPPTDPFSPLLDAQVIGQAILRQSGLGIADADLTQEWLANLLADKGFAPREVVVLDLHTCLAEAAYRTQGDDDTLVLTLHPLGDGTSMTVHRGHAGQLHKLWEQRGFASLQTHLQRASAALGLRPWVDDGQLWALAATAEPDDALVHELGELVFFEGPRISHHLHTNSRHPVYTALGRAEPAVAAASLLANLVGLVRDALRYHVQKTGLSRVALAGAVFDNPRLVAEIVEMEEIDFVWAGPVMGFAQLAVGAAVGQGGLAPREQVDTGLGKTWPDKVLRQELAVTKDKRVDAEPGAIAALLAEGRFVGRFVGASTAARSGLGRRSVLVRADDPVLLARARTCLGLPAHFEPGCAWLAGVGPGTVPLWAELGGSQRFGTIAPRVDADFAAAYPGVVLADGRVHLQQVDAGSDPELHAVLQALHASTGQAALAVLPLTDGQGPAVATPGDALRLWHKRQEDGVCHLVFGPYLLGGDSSPA